MASSSGGTAALGVHKIISNGNSVSRSVMVEVGGAGALSWLPRDALSDKDIRRLDRIIADLRNLGHQVELRKLPDPPADVRFLVDGQVVYLVGHVREFYADGTGPHYERAMAAVAAGKLLPPAYWTEES
eukprot:gnl/MRDRNA2_/MRDRNA2_52093_c0_seq1.p1 gnl/MRDRNA2_/MRDRNA2_52093_c0~~gnl/MRDRNA2_/MRDRNA2_52093_c0_seq1.p1  ORF type:complete len:129 (+),score=22.28 gnl/MRDRNA2_/MRDRNA2_52093_c0_seq1:108-494(+)